MSYIYPQKIAEVNGAVAFLREQGADIAASAVEALVQHLSLIERELDQYVAAGKRLAIEKAELGIENRRLKAINHLHAVHQVLEAKNSEASITKDEAPHDER